MMKKNNRYTKGLRWMHRWMLCSILLIGLNRLTAQSVWVGDLITFLDGSKGIVCYVDPENEQKGWVVDLNDLPGTYQLYTVSTIPTTTTIYGSPSHQTTKSHFYSLLSHRFCNKKSR